MRMYKFGKGTIASNMTIGRSLNAKYNSQQSCLEELFWSVTGPLQYGKLPSMAHNNIEIGRLFFEDR